MFYHPKHSPCIVSHYFMAENMTKPQFPLILLSLTLFPLKRWIL